MTEKLNANTTLDKILGYVDSPFKLFAVILMAVIAFAGFALYESQEFIRDAYKESQKLPEIRTDRADDAATMLFKQTGATVVAIFKVNPLSTEPIPRTDATRPLRTSMSACSRTTRRITQMWSS
jgi:hypothetical protein